MYLVFSCVNTLLIHCGVLGFWSFCRTQFCDSVSMTRKCFHVTFTARFLCAKVFALTNWWLVWLLESGWVSEEAQIDFCDVGVQCRKTWQVHFLFGHREDQSSAYRTDPFWTMYAHLPLVEELIIFLRNYSCVITSSKKVSFVGAKPPEPSTNQKLSLVPTDRVNSIPTTLKPSPTKATKSFL